jgi:UDPglucose 6-dehydrogenase
VVIINNLLRAGAAVRAHDPVAMKEARKIFKNRIQYVEDDYEAVRGADALAVVTEWSEFRTPDFQKIKRLMKKPVIFDGRNIYNKEETGSGFVLRHWKKMKDGGVERKEHGVKR